MEFISTVISCVKDSTIPHRSAVAMIAGINLISGVVDIVTRETVFLNCNAFRIHIISLKFFSVLLFQAANIMLLVAVIVENSLLVNIYLYYTLGFVKLGLILTLLEFLLRYQQSALWSVISMMQEVGFYFVLFRCLPIVDEYKRYLDYTYVKS